MSDERLTMLKWNHLKVELDTRENQWPEGSRYELDHDKRTVTWIFESQDEMQGRLIRHVSHDELWSPKPSEVAEHIIRQATELAVKER